MSLNELELEQVDVKTNFLHEELEDDIDMQQPNSVVVSRKDDCVCLLKKSFVGLKQFPRQWYKRFDSFFISHNFMRYIYENYVYLNDVMMDHSYISFCMLMIC